MLDRAAERIRAADAVLVQLRNLLETVCYAARLAAAAGVSVILDPAPAAPLPEGLLADATYLTPNEHEAECLTGIAVENESSARAGGHPAVGCRRTACHDHARGQGGLAGLGRRAAARRQPSGGGRRHDRCRRCIQWRIGVGLGTAVSQRRRGSRPGLVQLAKPLSATRLERSTLSLPTTAELEHFLRNNPMTSLATLKQSVGISNPASAAGRFSGLSEMLTLVVHLCSRRKSNATAASRCA